MPTKATTANAELQKLFAAQETARQKVRDEQRKRSVYQAVTEGLRGQSTAHRHSFPEQHDKGGKPLPGTDAEKLAAEVKERMGGQGLVTEAPFPDQEALDLAITEFHAAELAHLRFRLSNLGVMLEERRDAFDGDLETPLRELIAVLERYNAAVAACEELVTETDGLTTQHLAFDPRAREWLQALVRMLEESELFPPSLNEHGQFQVDRLLGNLDG